MLRAIAPYVAWPHRIDVGRETPWYDHGYCFGEPLLDLASGTFPTGLFQDPEIDLPASDFIPRSESDVVDQASCQYPQ
jgi:amidase